MGFGNVAREHRELSLRRWPLQCPEHAGRLALPALPLRRVVHLREGDIKAGQLECSAANAGCHLGAGLPRGNEKGFRILPGSLLPIGWAIAAGQLGGANHPATFGSSDGC